MYYYDHLPGAGLKKSDSFDGIALFLILSKVKDLRNNLERSVC